jgi:hypothetical protein
MMGFLVVVAVVMIFGYGIRGLKIQMKWYDLPLVIVTYGVWLIFMGMRYE